MTKSLVLSQWQIFRWRGFSFKLSLDIKNPTCPFVEKCIKYDYNSNGRMGISCSVSSPHRRFRMQSHIINFRNSNWQSFPSSRREQWESVSMYYTDTLMCPWGLAEFCEHSSVDVPSQSWEMTTRTKCWILWTVLVARKACAERCLWSAGVDSFYTLAIN